MIPLALGTIRRGSPRVLDRPQPISYRKYRNTTFPKQSWKERGWSSLHCER